MSAITYADAAPILRTSIKDSLGVLRRAAVLLGRHWPTLLTIALFGSATHVFLLWSAVRASRVSSGLGLVTLVLVPLPVMLSLVLMLRTLRPSLPYLTRVADTGERDHGGLMAVIGSVAVPYLTIYTTYDYLKDDVTSFTYEVWRDSDPGQTLSRLPFSPTVSVLGIIAIALGLRRLLGLVSAGPLRMVTAPLGAYVEVAWLSTVTIAGNQLKNFGTDWLDARRVGEWWHAIWGGPNSYYQPVREVLEAFWHNVDVVMFAPIAWLAMGAVVYGRQLTERRMTDERVATGAMRWASRLPGPLSFLGTSSGSALYGRFAPLINGLRLLARAGLRPMLVFCMAFVVLQLTPQGIWEIERMLIGPHDLEDFWMPMSYLTAPVNTAIRYVLIICLVAAATDRILQADSTTPDTASETGERAAGLTSTAHNEAAPSR